MELEKFFKQFREDTIGYNQCFEACYGENKMIYADWAATGRLYKPIEDRIISEFGPYIGNTHSKSSKTGMTTTIAYDIAREIIKRHVNANENDIIITSGFGTTSAVNKLQRILGLKPCERLRGYLKIPDEIKPVIFVTHMEHHSNYISWLETYSDVVLIEPNVNGFVDMDSLRYLLEKYAHRKYKIGAFTACSNVTGIETPYHEMAKIMHEHGGICCVDFAAAAPYIDIDMHPADLSKRLDAVYFSPHKFLGGPGTSGVLIFNSNLYENKIPDRPGGGTVNWTNPWGEKSYISNIEAREDGGTPGFLQAIKTSLCIGLKNKMTVEKILKREEEIMAILFSKLDNIEGLYILEGNVRKRKGIFSFYINNIHYNLLVRILNDRFGIQVRGGCSCAGPYGHYLLNVGREESYRITQYIDNGDFSNKPGWVRISIHPIMTNQEIYYIIDAIKETIRNIGKWQKDYRYDKRTNEFININISNEKHMVKQWFMI